jgi:hypothetical protein
VSHLNTLRTIWDALVSSNRVNIYQLTTLGVQSENIFVYIVMNSSDIFSRLHPFSE